MFAVTVMLSENVLTEKLVQEQILCLQHSFCFTIIFVVYCCFKYDDK